MKTRAALLLALPVLLFATASCRLDNRASVDIQQICYPPSDCKPSATCDKGLTGGYVMDVSLTAVAPMFVQVANRLADNGDATLGRTNTNDAHIDGIDIEYDGLPIAGTGKINLTNQYVPAAGTTVVLIPGAAFNSTQLATLQAGIPAGGGGSFVSRIRLRGYLTDGTRFETGEFRTAIGVCNGCLSADPCGSGKAACPDVGVDPVTCGTTGG